MISFFHNYFENGAFNEGVASTKEIMGTRILQRSRACRQDIAAFRVFQDFGGLFREFMEICNILHNQYYAHV